MKRYLLYSSLVVFIISCSFSENFTSDVNLYESKTNYTPKKYDKILICGSGAKQVRLFLENLSGKLFKDFEKDGVQTKYIYLGNGPENSDSALRKLANTGQFNAFMIFFEKDLPGEIKIQPRKTNFKKSNREFDQLLGIKLYDNSGVANSIWDANLKVNFNLTNDKTYSDISAMILRRLSENKIIGQYRQ